MHGLLRFLTGVILLALIGGVAWWITAPAPLDRDMRAALESAAADPARGERIFLAAGCGACHTAPGATEDARLILSGGQRFPSDFGTFLAPNISPDPDHGIGDWDLYDLALALTEGVSPEGAHYYPAFPYSAYNKMVPGDIADLWAYLQSLPPSNTPSLAHEIGFPFSMRRSLGGWKWLYLSDDWMLDVPEDSPEDHGRYLVEALGHCGECHTPRNQLGGLETTRWLGGAPSPDGKGRVPNIAPGKLSWDASEIAYYLETGFTPEFDSVGGHMAPVVENYGRLPAEDRAAVAAYLKAVPSISQ